MLYHNNSFPQWGTKKWDTCAIDALFHAQGGKFTDSFGVPMDYSYVPGEDPNNRHGRFSLLLLYGHTINIDMTNGYRFASDSSCIMSSTVCITRSTPTVSIALV
jgi:hypothetical protein